MKPLVLGESVLYNDSIPWPPKYNPRPGTITHINDDGTYGVSYLMWIHDRTESKWSTACDARYGFRDGYLPEGHFARVGEVGPLCKQIMSEGE